MSACSSSSRCSSNAQEKENTFAPSPGSVPIGKCANPANDTRRGLAQVDRAALAARNREENAAAGASMFGRLLGDVQTELRMDCDGSVARQLSQREEKECEEVQKREEDDVVRAKQLQTEYEDELVAHEIREQEKRMEELQRTHREQSTKQDAELAHRLVMNDEESALDAKRREEEDLDFAKQVAAHVEDELIAEELQEKELNLMAERVKARMAQEEADAKFAAEQQEELDALARQHKATIVRRDSQLAEKLQTKLDGEAKRESRRKQNRFRFWRRRASDEEQADYEYACTVHRQLQRQQHREETKAAFTNMQSGNCAVEPAWTVEKDGEEDQGKRAEAETNDCDVDDADTSGEVIGASQPASAPEDTSATNAMTDLVELRRQWRYAVADVDDVADGIAITLYLPHLAALQVSLENCALLHVFARRAALPQELALKEEAAALRSKSASVSRGPREVDDDEDEKAWEPCEDSKAAETSMDLDSKHDEDSMEFEAEFRLSGFGIRVKNEDVSYDYNSADGLLHIYVDHIQLQERSENPVSDEQASSRGTVGRFADSIRESFRRVFKSDSAEA